MKIQSHLFVLTLGTVAPLVAVLVAGGVVLWKAERESLEREAIGRTRAAMSAIDTELRGSIAALKALAASKNLDSGDIRAFHAEAQRVLASQPQWLNIGLATVKRDQLLDAILPFGAHAAFSDDDAFDKVLRTRAPQISSLAQDGAVPLRAVRLRVPVFIRGQMRHVLSAPLDASSFDALLRAQRLPDGWTIALADRNKRFIARIPPKPAGTGISQDLAAALDRSPEGWFHGRTLEGAETFTPYVSSELSGWVLAIAMPAEVVRAGTSRAAVVSALGGLIALAIALALAWIIAQRIARPIADLANAADHGLENELPPPSAIDEIARLHKALADAAHALGERQRRLEKEQSMLVTQSHLLRQRTEEAETLMQVMPIAVFKADDLECRVITANPAGCRFLQLEAQACDANIAVSVAWPAGLSIARAGRELQAGELPLVRAIAQGAEQPAEELEFRFADGEVKFGFVYAAPLFGSDARARGAVCAILDITERKLDDRRKDEFLATLAHELRNPLAPAMNALQLLRVAPSDAAAAATARDMLDRQIRQMKRLIDDLMDVSRITQGKLVLQRERVRLQTIVDDAVDACRASLTAKAHRLEVDIPRAPIDVTGDPARLTQMLSNLLGNSCKFTPPGGRIRLHAHAEGVNLTISVSDDGVGIAPQLLPRVFDLFMQGDRALERTTDGQGIGLSLVRRLAEMHGGSVEARSEGVGRGAEFIVRLPILSTATATATAQQAHVQSKEELMTLRILVVDDSRDAAESLATLLELSGHTVDIANDGLVALQSAEQLKPDVVFMDIGMPRLNGFDAARRIRAAPWGKRMTLVAISGWGQDSDRAKSKEAGFDAHLVKPMEFPALEQILAQVSARLQGAS